MDRLYLYLAGSGIFIMNMSARRRKVLLPLIRTAVMLAAALPAVSCRTLPFTSWSASSREFLPQWEPFAADTTQALSFLAGKVREPRLEFWALRVDLEAPEVRIVVNGPEPVGGELREGHIPSTTVSRFVREYGCLAGINANPFSPASGRTGEDRIIDGVVVAEGITVSRPDPAFDALVFYEAGAGGRGGAAIVSQGEILSLEGIRDAVGGFSIVLRDGKTAGSLRTSGTASFRHPRSAAGLSGDGRYLYLLAVDGRRPGSVGVTEAELAELLRRLGAAEGLNFDGGGSTSLALRFPGGKVRPVNTPIHNRVPGRERGVAACLGITVEGGAR
jgi:hypothetical protein